MTSSRTFRLLPASISLAGALALGALVPAHASSTTKTDPEGDVFLAEVGGGMDLASVRLESRERKKRVRVTFRLHEPVQGVSLRRPGGLFVKFVTGRRTSRVVEVFTDRGHLRGAVCRNATADTPHLRDCHSLEVTQIDDTTYRTVVGLARIKEDAKVLRWTAWSMDLSNGDPVSDDLTAGNGKPFRWSL